MDHLARFARNNTRVLGLAALLLLGCATAFAASKENIDQEVDAALKSLYARAPTAKQLAPKAKAILVFPSVRKAGLVVGGQRGEGALVKRGRKVGYYSTSALSVGFEAGAQSYSFALFFMTDAALSAFEKSNGFEIGVGPNVVFVDAGAAKDMSSLTANADVYGYVFGQKGLMAGISLQGTKISKITPEA